VPAYGRQEVAVLQGGRPGLQVLRAPHAPRPQPFKKACGNAARAPVPTARRHRGRHHRSALGRRRRCHQRQQLPEPLPLPGHCRQHWWRWRGQQYLYPVLLVDGVVSAAHGQCCQLRSSWWWNCKGSQVTVLSFLSFFLLQNDHILLCYRFN